MIVKGWKGATYGVRVGRRNAQVYFRPQWRSVRLDLDGKVYRVPLSEAFWAGCPELRSAVIGKWLRVHLLAPWPKGKPPQLELVPLGDDFFSLKERE